MILLKLQDVLRRAGIDLKRARDPYDLPVYRRIYDDKTLQLRPFFNIGAGSFFHPYWTNIDFVSDWYGGVQKNIIHHDLMSWLDLPIIDESAKIHISYNRTYHR